MGVSEFVLDEKDMLILNTLISNSKLSIYQISKQTGIPTTTVHNRIKRLEDEKVILSYTIDVDYKKIKRDVIVYVLISHDLNEMVKAGLTSPEVTKQFESIKEIEDIAYTTGRFDAIFKLRLKSIRDLNAVLVDKIRKIPGVDRTESMYSVFHKTTRRI